MGWRQLLARIPAYIPLLGTALAISGCAKTPQSLFDPHGPVAKMEVDLLNLSLYIAIFIGVAVTAILLYILFRFRTTGAPVGEPPEQIHGSAKMELGWTLIPIVILAVTAIPSIRVANVVYNRDIPGAMHVKATGIQWFFQFEYVEPKFTVANELVIPVGKPVVLQLHSNDVIHSFWVPKLGGKTDMIPGRNNVTWLQADTPGLYYGQCAEYCLTAHSLMRFRVRAVPQQEFDAWVARRQAGAAPTPPTDALAARGRALFEGVEKGRVTCFACHAVEGTTAKAQVGPNLTNIAERSTIGAGLVPNTTENLKKWIRDPHVFKPGARMPQHAHLKEEELDAIVAYLQTLK